MLPGSETVSRLLCVGKWKIYTITTATFSTPQSQSKKGALMESWQFVEHEFETTGSNRAQTRAAGGGWGGLTAGCSKGEGCWYGEGIQMGRKENLPVWGKYDRLYGVV